MAALYQTAGEVRAEVSLAHKRLLLLLAMLIAFVVVALIDTGYTTPRAAQGTVVAKTQGASNGQVTDAPYFVVAIRHPDGSIKDIKTDSHRYSQTEVGGKWEVTVSDMSMGLPMPFKHKLVLAVLGLLMLCGVVTLVRLLRMFDYRE